MIPDLKNELDTSNFEIIDEAEPFYPPAQPKKKKHRRDPNFVGFTYKRDVEEEKEGILKAFQEIKQQRVIKLRPMSASRSTNK